MKLNQLKLFCHVVDYGMNISSAARAAHTSQPSVSRHLQALEQELGVSLFLRSKKRILGLTDSGRETLKTAKRVVSELDNLTHLANARANGERGNITISASQTHARYLLPDVVERFRRVYPKIRLVFRVGDPDQIIQWLMRGNADLAISADPLEPVRNLVCFPCREVQRLILTPPNHPLAKVKRPTLQRLAKYPLITYDSQFTFHRMVLDVFRKADLAPNIVLSATDVDVIKAYVKRGLGVAIVAATAFDPSEDKKLCAVAAGHLFPTNSIKLWLRRDAPLPSYIYHFLEMLSPSLKPNIIREALLQA
jgi:LysR family transcriptional regulator, cys regulon transcriptional activator